MVLTLVNLLYLWLILSPFRLRLYLTTKHGSIGSHTRLFRLLLLRLSWLISKHIVHLEYLVTPHFLLLFFFKMVSLAFTIWFCG